MAALDRKRPFGEVFGPADHKYVQDGKKFDHEDNEIGASEKPAKAAKAAPKSDVVDQVGAQLNG